MSVFKILSECTSTTNQPLYMTVVPGFIPDPSGGGDIPLWNVVVDVDRHDDSQLWTPVLSTAAQGPHGFALLNLKTNLVLSQGSLSAVWLGDIPVVDVTQTTFVYAASNAANEPGYAPTKQAFGPLSFFDVGSPTVAALNVKTVSNNQAALITPIVWTAPPSTTGARWGFVQVDNTTTAVTPTAAQGWQLLLDGNDRYRSGELTEINDDVLRRVAVAALNPQKPFAMVLSCVDSRVPPETIFDRGLGDVLVIRTAGHVFDHAVLGSLEYGFRVLGIPLLVVLGHERCGAVAETVDHLNLTTPAETGTGSTTPDIPYLLAQIGPAVLGAHSAFPILTGDALKLASVKNNVAVDLVRLAGAQNTMTPPGPLFDPALITIRGMFYDLDSGAVSEILSTDAHFAPLPPK